MQARLAEREQALDELELALSLSQRRAATSTRKRNAEGRRAAGLQVRLSEAEERAAIAQLRVVELEQEVLALRAELESVTAAWHAAEHQRQARLIRRPTSGNSRYVIWTGVRAPSGSSERVSYMRERLRNDGRL